MSEVVVSLNHVNIYQSGNLILQEVNFEVQKGEFVYLVGKTGTGKSSLLKSLYGEITLTEGEGTVVGFDLKEIGHVLGVSESRASKILKSAKNFDNKIGK